MAVDLESGVTTDVMPLVTQAEYADGNLLFVRERALMARPFDPDSLEFTGDAVPVAEGVLVVSGASLAAFSASGTGILSYITGRPTCRPNWNGMTDRGRSKRPSAIRVPIDRSSSLQTIGWRRCWSPT